MHNSRHTHNQSLNRNLHITPNISNPASRITTSTMTNTDMVILADTTVRNHGLLNCSIR